MSDYGVSRIVVRNAVEVLTNEGLVVKHQGRGAFVRDQTPAMQRIVGHLYESRPTDSPFAAVTAAAGQTPEWEYQSRRTTATANIAERLGIQRDDPVMCTNYRFTADGQPVMLSTSYEPLELTAGTPIESPEAGPVTGVVPRMDSIGLHIVQVTEQVTARAHARSRPSSSTSPPASPSSSSPAPTEPPNAPSKPPTSSSPPTATASPTTSPSPRQNPNRRTMTRLVELIDKLDEQALDIALTPLMVGVDTEDRLLWKSAIGFTARAWRMPAEEWHHLMSDGEMMRINSSTVKLVRSRLTTTSNDWTDIARDMTSPDRKLPTGRTLTRLLGKRRLEEFSIGANVCAETQEMAQDQRGTLYSLKLAILLGQPRGGDWHGTSEWTKRVDAFCKVVNDPDNEHWNIRALSDLGPRPADIQETEDLRRLLLEGPDKLSAPAAEWCMRAALRYVNIDVDR